MLGEDLLSMTPEELSESVETRMVPGQTYLFKKEWFEKGNEMDWDLDDKEVRCVFVGRSAFWLSRLNKVFCFDDCQSFI
jgi:hypothetical protein